MLALRALVALSALFSAVKAVPQVTRTGRYLYSADGTRFYIKGIGYQPQGERHESTDNPFGEPGTFIDPLADGAGCRRDATRFQEAGINAIRVYTVDATLDHDECMQVFDEAGIYVILDLSAPLVGSIDRLAPTWTTNLLNFYLATIDAFNEYPNILAYNVGNEVVLGETLDAAPFVKAAARDIKAHLRSINSNALVGYAAINGVSGFRFGLAEYLSCGSDETAIDIYGLNEYTWCGSEGSFTGGSGYSTLVTEFADYNVVAYFSEYGCVTNPPRDWSEVDSLFSSDMSDVWSGGIAFNYFPALAEAEYGMSTVDGDEVTVSGEFTALGERYNAIVPPNTPSQAEAAAATYPACGTDLDASNTLPGTPSSEACGCLSSALSCRFSPPSGANATAVSDIVGELINVGCSLLDGAGGSCTDLGGDGETGVYGRVSGCDPETKLSYIMSQFYEAEGRAAQACDFSGNATLNSGASSTDSATDLAESCVASPDAVFAPAVPTSSPTSPNTGTTSRPASNGGSGGSGGGNTGGNSNTGSGALGLSDSLFGVGAMAVVAFTSAVWTLL